MIQDTKIYITKTDREKIGKLIQMIRFQHDRNNFSYINRLEEELEDAEIVEPENIPSNVVTMHSTVKLRDLDSDEQMIYSIVFPPEASHEDGRISILAPLATALLGYKCGDTVQFIAPSRERRLKIEEILYQPESSGDFDL